MPGKTLRCPTSSRRRILREHALLNARFIPATPEQTATMPKANAPTVARLLREFGQYSALQGGNPYRAKAYARAADSIGALIVPLDQLVKEGLTEIPGVGDAIADIVTKLHKAGTHPKLEQMRKEIPPGVLEMLSVPGLRPEKVLKLHRELGISSLSELEAAA